MNSLERLQALIGRLRASNRFYSTRLASCGIDENIASLKEFTRRMTFTRKEELVADQAENPPYGSNHTYPLERYTRFCQTSGTSGRPLIWLDTNESWGSLIDNWLRIYEAGGVQPGDRIYFAFSFGPFLGFWTAFEAGVKAGFLCMPGGGLSSAQRLRVLIQNQATVLCCTPTYALRLAEVAQEEGIPLKDAAVRKIFVAGEPGGSVPEVRTRISEAWNGARVLDHYGMTEVGPVSYENLDEPCVQRVNEESYFAEVVQPESGESVPDGGVGELVLTTLKRDAAPLLRYRTGDLVKARRDERGLRLEGGIIGRADDMIVVRGVNLYPSSLDAVIRTIPEITEYRAEISRRGELTEVTVRIEAVDDGAARKLEKALSTVFSLRIPVIPAPAGSLPRFELKARRWVRTD